MQLDLGEKPPPTPCLPLRHPQGQSAVEPLHSSLLGRTQVPSGKYLWAVATQGQSQPGRGFPVHPAAFTQFGGGGVEGGSILWDSYALTGSQGLQGISNSRGTPLPVSPLPSTDSCLHIFTQTPAFAGLSPAHPPPQPNFKMQLRALRALPGVHRLKSSFHDVLSYINTSLPVPFQATLTSLDSWTNLSVLDSHTHNCDSLRENQGHDLRNLHFLRHRPSSEPVLDLRKYPVPLGIFSPVDQEPSPVWWSVSGQQHRHDSP